jgi:hypothetical protein
MSNCDRCGHRLYLNYSIGESKPENKCPICGGTDIVAAAPIEINPVTGRKVVEYGARVIGTPLAAATKKRQRWPRSDR